MSKCCYICQSIDGMQSTDEFIHTFRLITATLLAGVESCSLMNAIDLNMGSRVTFER